MEKVVKMDRDMTKVRGGITKELFNVLKIAGQSEFLSFTDVKTPLLNVVLFAVYLCKYRLSTGVDDEKEFQQMFPATIAGQV